MHGIRLSFVSAGSPTLSANRPYEAYYNYFLGNDSSRWASRVRSFRSVWYCDMYDAVDVELRPRPGGLKYNIVVHPGGDLAAVGMHIEGANGVYLLRDKLYIEMAYGNMVEQIPLAYQVIGGERRTLSCSYYLKDDNTVGFRVSGYDPTQALVIDPELIGSSLSGASADNRAYSACPDAEGNIYLSGVIFGESVGQLEATPGVIQERYENFVFGLFQYAHDACIAKFNTDLSELLFFTYLGGASGESEEQSGRYSRHTPLSTIISEDNYYYLLARTTSDAFPVDGTRAYQKEHGGGSSDFALVKMSPDGTELLGSTYLGGSGSEGEEDGANASPDHYERERVDANYNRTALGEVEIDEDGKPVFVSYTTSSDFPLRTSRARLAYTMRCFSR